jgi:hypothetical protein
MEELFKEILRERLSEEQFIRFVMDWFDPDTLCSMIEDVVDNADEISQKEYLELIIKYLHNEQ